MARAQTLLRTALALAALLAGPLTSQARLGETDTRALLRLYGRLVSGGVRMLEGVEVGEQTLEKNGVVTRLWFRGRQVVGFEITHPDPITPLRVQEILRDSQGRSFWPTGNTESDGRVTFLRQDRQAVAVWSADKRVLDIRETGAP